MIYQHATEERDQAVAQFLESQIAAVERSSLAPVQSIGTAKITRSENRTRDPRVMETASTDVRRPRKRR